MARKNTEEALKEKARLSKIVYLLRVTSKKTQSSIAKAIEKTFQQVQKYEGGKNSMSSPMLFALAKAEGWDINTLYYGDPEEMIKQMPLDFDTGNAKKHFLNVDSQIEEERKLQARYEPLMHQLNQELAGQNTFKG